jgi:hypothetical protein
VIFLVTGSNKVKAVLDWQASMPMPAASINPETGIDIYCENAAMGN